MKVRRSLDLMVHDCYKHEDFRELASLPTRLNAASRLHDRERDSEG